MASGTGTSHSELSAGLKQVPGLRRMFDPAIDSKLSVIITGEPANWSAAAKQLKARRCEIQAFHEYDHPVVHARRGDVVTDGGAYHGQTSLMYAEGQRLRARPRTSGQCSSCTEVRV